MTLAGWWDEDGAGGKAALIANGLVGRWRFLEGSGSAVADASGNGRSATLTASPTWGAGYPQGEGSLLFNGSSQYATIADNDAFSVTTTNAMTWSCWYFANTNSGGPSLMSKGSGAGYEWALRPESFTVWRSGGENQAVIGEPAFSISRVGQWTHVAATYQTGVIAKLFLNGAVFGSTTSFSGTPSNTTSPVNLARRADNVQYFNGRLSDCRIYNRALTDQEIYRIAKLRA